MTRALFFATLALALFALERTARLVDAPSRSSDDAPRLSSRPVVRVSNGTRRVPCDVPCLWPAGAASAVVRTLTLAPLGATMLYSMEGEEYYPQLALRHRTATHAIASTRMDSDVPLPYFSWAEYDIRAAPLDLDAVLPAASFIASNCASKSHRETFVLALREHGVRVDGLGSCLHTRDVDRRRPKRDLMRPYALHLALENQRVDDYITEKLWGTLAAGVLPVYLGAPNVAQHVPARSIVDAQTFESPRALAAHLRQIVTNRTLYESYHAWRARPLPRWFVRKYAFTHTHSECRVCQWVARRLS